jgi:hypothetical protein
LLSWEFFDQVCCDRRVVRRKCFFKNFSQKSCVVK